ncbi:hypothetical protein JOF56_007416 [Kibdelosporangium banguiense]|uniref:Peptidase C14 caspase domain-containing protein n=1 Tax=Kibdelosporangium banguiense TaxID=1365924 RepID=A0ABS4TRJ1_9PSEU|nr:caspase family protein [Kibdelosporangium banguiense]MBP2327031.1 hypothetical protein [Kibdelosporangium banguiense]
MGRHALLIATGSYEDPLLGRLRSPAQDVKRLAAVLRDPALGAFDEVTICVDQPEHRLRVAVEDVLCDRSREDLVVVYLSCHGIRDRRGRLYFAAIDTRLDRLAATALASTFLDEQMSASTAGGRVLILDCCFSGSFAHGLAVKSSAVSPLVGSIGRGYFGLTATDAFEYAFEGTTPRGLLPRPSVCTEVIVTGLETGQADRDGDGWVSAYDLYDYVYDVVKQTAPQTPTYFASHVEGRLLLSRVPQAAQPLGDRKPDIPIARQVTHRPSILRRARRHARAIIAVVIMLVAVAAVLVADRMKQQTLSESYALVTSARPLVDDSLRDNHSDNRWGEGSGTYGDCTFADGAYHARPRQLLGQYHVCCRSDIRRDDFAVQVDVRIAAGDEGGLAFRWNNSIGYFFHVTSTGNYHFFATDRTGKNSIRISGSSSPHPAIKRGTDQVNVLAVLAQGSIIHLFVNGEHLDTVDNSTYPEGGISLCAQNFSNGTDVGLTDVAFNNLKVWRA